jgi:hypothetical protein
MVEFAIVATVLLFIIVGILYFGRFLSYTEDQTHLANIAARWAAVAQDPGCASGSSGCPALYQYVQGQADPGELQSGSSDVTQKAKVCITLPNGTGNVGDPVQATVTATFHFLPFLNVPDLPVTETATMRLEQPLSTANSQIIGCST